MARLSLAHHRGTRSRPGAGWLRAPCAGSRSLTCCRQSRSRTGHLKTGCRRRWHTRTVHAWPVAVAHEPDRAAGLVPRLRGPGEPTAPPAAAARESGPPRWPRAAGRVLSCFSQALPATPGGTPPTGTVSGPGRPAGRAGLPPAEAADTPEAAQAGRVFGGAVGTEPCLGDLGLTGQHRLRTGRAGRQRLH